jgi:hypothetical protein
MVEKILVKGQLTREMIEAGRDLLARLKESNHEVVAAYWLYNSDAGEWRLTLAMPEVDAHGPREVYSRIWSLLAGDGGRFIGLDLSNITVISPNDPFVTTLAAYTTRPAPHNGPTDARMSRIELGGTYVEDIYLYFVTGRYSAAYRHPMP